METGHSLPEFVSREFDAFLQCGVLAHGFLRGKCEECQHETLVAFSCKCRGFCPSCGARRMAETAAHLVEEVIPELPVRQWVLSLPIPLRYLLASHPQLLGPVLNVVHRAVSGLLPKKAGIKRTEGQGGGVTFVQRFGSALNLNIHFHCLVLDGVYHRRGEKMTFRPVEAPTQSELNRLLERLVKRLMRLLTRRGYLIEEQGQTWLGEENEEGAMTNLQAAATSYRIGLGPRRGKKVPTLRTLEAESGGLSTHCAQLNGFSLHAGVSCKANQRGELERLCRYVARPAIANERLRLSKCGQVALTLKTPYRNGTTHIVMSPLELLQKLAALVPRPGLNLIRFHSVLAPNAKRRSQLVPGRRSASTMTDIETAETGEFPDEDIKGGGRRSISWARLLKRVFGIDVEICPCCGGRLKIIAVIEDPPEIRKILTHLGLSPHPPPRSSARYDPYVEADLYSI